MARAEKGNHKRDIPYTRAKSLAVMVLMLLVLGATWQGAVDDAARSYLNGAIQDAAVIYGLARVMNAAVSVLQSIDVSVVFASIQLGDVLTPVHDTLERFSDVMTISIVSLTLQRVLVEIVEHPFFNVLLTLSGLGLCWAVVTGRCLSYAVKVFLTLFFMRFSLALVLLVNMAVDQGFLQPKIQAQTENFSAIQHDLDAVYALVATDEAEQSPPMLTTDAYADRYADSSVNRDAASSAAEDKSVEEEANQPIWVSIKGSANAVREAVRETVAGVVSSGATFLHSKDHVVDQLLALKSKSIHWVEYFLTLIALMLLQTIILPVLFWYVMLQGMKLIWRHDWAQYQVRVAGVDERHNAGEIA